MLPSVLIIDDEIDVVKALERVLRKNFKVVGFTNVREALQYFESSPTHLVMSDMRMPDMNGAEFLKLIAEQSIRTKRIVLTGYADADLAQQAINEGHISLYLYKPWSNEKLIERLLDLVGELKDENKLRHTCKKLALDNKQLKLSQYTPKLLEENFLSVNNDNIIENAATSSENAAVNNPLAHLKKINNELLMLNANVIAMATGDNTGQGIRVAQQAKCLALRLGMSEVESLHVYLAGLYYRVGLMSIRKELLAKSWKELSIDEQREASFFSQVSYEVMQSSSLLEESAIIVKHLFERVDGIGEPAKLLAEEIPLGTKVLRAVIEVDNCTIGIRNGNIVSPMESFALLKKEVGLSIDSVVLNHLFKMVESPKKSESFEYICSATNLKVGMVLAHDIIDEQHHKLLNEDTKLTESHIERLITYQETIDCLLLAFVRTPVALPENEYKEDVSE